MEVNSKLVALDNSELQTINGGAIPPIVWGPAIWLANEIINNWQEIKRGAVDAFNEVSYS